MKRTALPSMLYAIVLFVWSMPVGAAAAEQPGQANAKPADRVVVMYFHRTHRCPTCQRMGDYSEEAVKEGFASRIKDGTVEFRYIDFQAEKNAALTKGYKITGPSLVVAKVVQGKVADSKNLKEIWSKKDDKDDFLKYVRDEVAVLAQSTSIAQK
ncbi:MAG: hypothetical protein JW818_21920 [Pirellulales bacterium]|nr:hypothetical protein [Pirellulales bacterium]